MKPILVAWAGRLLPGRVLSCLLLPDLLPVRLHWLRLLALYSPVSSQIGTVCQCWSGDSLLLSPPVAEIIQEEAYPCIPSDYSFGMQVRSLIYSTAPHQPFPDNVSAIKREESTPP